MFHQHSKFTVYQVRNMHLVFRGQEYPCRGLILLEGCCSKKFKWLWISNMYALLSITAALASHYPDLQVLDLDNPTPPLLLHHELRPSSHHTQRTAVAEARPTIQPSPPPISTPSPASTSRSLFRPHSRPHPTPGYVAIVKHWLRPFTADSN